jgi:hypothetical protein
MGLQTGYGMTRKEFEKYKALALARNDVDENRKKFWKNSQITDADIEYMKKALEAPDVNLFLKVI